MKHALNKVTSQNFVEKLGVGSGDNDDIVKFRKQCKSITLRHIYYRLISGDFFTKERGLLVLDEKRQ